MILGMHDRNRALHGDVVVVRLKERNQWVVRESLYEAWRNGQLNAPCDEDGQPLPIPPVKAEESTSVDDLLLAQAVNFLPSSLQQQVLSTNLNQNVAQPKNKRYTQSTFLKLGVQVKRELYDRCKISPLFCLQLEMRRLKQDQKSPSDSGDAATANNKNAQPPAEINPAIGEALSRLCISKDTATPAGTSTANEMMHTAITSPPTTSSHTSVNPTAAAESASTTTMAANKPRRAAYRQLAEMSDEDWGLPDICLQKTAEVVYMIEAKNCRTAVGQLKVWPAEAVGPKFKMVTCRLWPTATRIGACSRQTIRVCREW